RVSLTQDFRDLVGDGNLVPLVVGTFLVSTAYDPGTTTPGAAADQVLEEFTAGGSAPGSLQDTTTPLVDPPATWGQGGTLAAGFAFDGTGGPGGTFDWQIGTGDTGAAPAIILDTTFSIITNVQQTAQETVINGRVDVRNFTV